MVSMCNGMVLKRVAWRERAQGKGDALRPISGQLAVG